MRGRLPFNKSLGPYIDAAEARGVKWAMALFMNVGTVDRRVRMVTGIALGVAGILMNGHPNLGRGLGLAGALLILSGICGT